MLSLPIFLLRALYECLSLYRCLSHSLSLSHILFPSFFVSLSLSLTSSLSHTHSRSLSLAFSVPFWLSLLLSLALSLVNVALVGARAVSLAHLLSLSCPRCILFSLSCLLLLHAIFFGRGIETCTGSSRQRRGRAISRSTRKTLAASFSKFSSPGDFK